jgi:hypothetical protein
LSACPGNLGIAIINKIPLSAHMLNITLSLLSNDAMGVLIMKCPKCKGRMFNEKFYDYVRSFDAWKCTCCGEVLDPTILTNRARSHNHFLG